MWLGLPTVLISLALAGQAVAEAPAPAAVPEPPRKWALHWQATVVEQFHPGFRSPYRGAQSLDPGARGNETIDATLYAGARLARGLEAWVNPEVDQGFGLSNTLGVAGFPSGEAYKVGRSVPYIRLQRFFARQTWNLDGETETVESELNQLGGTRSSNRMVLTAGKFSVGDVFDSNALAHDPRNDFLNWTLIDTGTFDYAADAWGYAIGGALELYRSGWVVRGGIFDLSIVPNSETLDTSFKQFQLLGEVERDWRWRGREGRARVTGFYSRGRMARFSDAIRLAEETGEPADVALVRRYTGRPGIGLTLEQQLSGNFAAFLRVGQADGTRESYEFTDVDATVAAGGALKGLHWGRPDDVWGFGGVINQASALRRQYLALGGLGILVGDGQLPHPAHEKILETWYCFSVTKQVRVTVDYQFVADPAFNRDRGPVSIFALRLHAQGVLAEPLRHP